ncbi:hypothetical protein Daus18300_009243 [Diaporthe australafricana]|uniref:Ketoreductase (KR) domain-containing protein n=1 Tax=Diaporthe australafricana TaxID=127596 RepID=A0ABR3WEV5_9PEZI
MSLDQFNDVTGPKMYANIYLDRLFRYQPLELYILFSSISCLFGNPGQANYCAANTYRMRLTNSLRKLSKLVASRVRDCPELSTGLLDVKADSPDALMWSSDPKFAGFIVDKVESDEGLKHSVVESLPDILMSFQNLQDLERVVKLSFGIRDWFLKTFQVSVAVLKIIGNNTMASLAEDVAGLVA